MSCERCERCSVVRVLDGEELCGVSDTQGVVFDDVAVLGR